VTKPGPTGSDGVEIRAATAPAVDCSAVRYTSVLTGKRRPEPRLIVDFVPVGIDLDVIEIRLLETFDVVDVFVLYEAVVTQTATSKPLYLRESMVATQRWKPFEGKILPLVGAADDLADLINATLAAEDAVGPNKAWSSSSASWALERSMRYVSRVNSDPSPPCGMQLS